MSISTRTINDALYAVREAMESERPDNETDAVELAQQAIHYLIDAALIYTADILEYWDGSTHPDIFAGMGEVDLMQLVTQSVALDLAEQWNDAIYDGIDAYIAAHFPHPDMVTRDEALEHIANPWRVTYASAGCLPDSDDGPALFATARDAWNDVAADVEALDESDYLDAHTALHLINRDAAGSIPGPGLYAWTVERIVTG